MTTRMNTPALKTVTLYDTMTREKRPLEPIEPGKISMYVCGVTVYDLTHIGHARTFTFFDMVNRVLKHLGYEVKFVRNHTDVDDKIIHRAKERGVDPLELSAHFIDAFHEDMSVLGVSQADVEPKVSEHMDQIISMIQVLMDKGFAYAADGDVYFRVREFQGYGKLSGRKLEDMEAGRSGRVEEDTAKKEYPFDFALWKAVKPDEISWESPWGPGRPGWHIECSAMSIEHLGESFDIHGGGADLMFPHHENEIAQSESATGRAPFARNWMHVSMLNVDGVKMGKSLGNFWTTRDVLERYHPEAIRFFMSTTH
ncbi:MAG: cysteine--tRNA ligase, partial [Myxococcota bacterium]